MFEMLMGKNSNANEGPPGVKFLGEVDTTDLINGLDLASAIGLTAGVAQHTDSPWLHFVLDDVELYVAKKTYRHSVSWDQINTAGVVFGSSTVEINGKTYKVRLLKTVATGDLYVGSVGYDRVGTHGSEWNRLMYSVHSGNHTHVGNPYPVSGEGIKFGTLAQYTDTDLVVHKTAGNGSYCWCQETSSADNTRRIYRGNNGVSNLSLYAAALANSATGWRPVLELVE